MNIPTDEQALVILLRQRFCNESVIHNGDNDDYHQNPRQETYKCMCRVMHPIPLQSYNKHTVELRFEDISITNPNGLF